MCWNLGWGGLGCNSFRFDQYENFQTFRPEQNQIDNIGFQPNLYYNILNCQNFTYDVYLYLFFKLYKKWV